MNWYEIALIVLAVLALIVVVALGLTAKERKRKKEIAKAKMESGSKGEEVTADVLQALQGKNYLLNGLIIEYLPGKTSEMDHVLVRQNGIFCIETKAWGGRITGSEKDEFWLRQRGGSFEKMKNPLVQNAGHVRTLKRVLGEKNIKCKVVPVIVFAKNNASSVDCGNVVNLRDLDRWIARYDDGTCYSKRKMKKIYKTLKKASGKVSHAKHVKNLRRNDNK